MRPMVTLLLLSPAIFHSCSGQVGFMESKKFRSLRSEVIEDSGSVPTDQQSEDAIPIPEEFMSYKTLNLNINCNSPMVKNIELETDRKFDSLKVQLRGEVCPRAVDKLHVLVLMDFSGSMGMHRSPRNQELSLGNDPMLGDTCGRREALKKLQERILQDKSEEDQVFISLVPFAGDIVEDYVQPFVPIEDMRAAADEICLHLVQSSEFGYHPENPGGLNYESLSNQPDQSTNFKRAFRRAQQELEHISTAKIVYMISDGYPTSGGSDPLQASIQAGEELRDRVDNLTLNSILLGEDLDEARDLLSYVAGSPERVQVVENAGQLAEEIVNFPPPLLDIDSASAYMVANGSQEDRELGFSILDGNSDGMSYELKPIFIELAPSYNRIRIEIEGEEGTMFSHVVNVTIFEEIRKLSSHN